MRTPNRVTPALKSASGRYEIIAKLGKGGTGRHRRRTARENKRAGVWERRKGIRFPEDLARSTVRYCVHLSFFFARLASRSQSK